MKCVIVAAGQGVRLREKIELKPLVPVAGTPLIEHVIRRARAAGVADILVVSGFRGDELRAFLDTLSARERIPLTHIVNDEWQRPNGVSLLKAKPHIDAPFVLTMCDHIVDPALTRGLIAADLAEHSVRLAVDFKLDNALVDLDDVTRVACTDGQIRRIGKLIPDYNAYDTGVFKCTPAIFTALEASQAQGEDSISAAMTTLAASQQAHAYDIGDKLWIDVDDATALLQAEQLLLSGRL